MIKKNYLVVVFLLVLLKAYLMSDENSFFRDHAVTLPLDETLKAWHVTIPEDYFLAYQADNSKLFLEFIPKGEELHSWTRIITITAIEDINVSLPVYMQIFEESLKKDVVHFSIITKKAGVINDIGLTYTGLYSYYEYSKGVYELLQVQAIQTQYLTYIVQMTAIYDFSSSDLTKKKAKTEITNFFNNISIINLNDAPKQ